MMPSSLQQARSRLSRQYSPLHLDSHHATSRTNHSRDESTHHSCLGNDIDGTVIRQTSLDCLGASDVSEYFGKQRVRHGQASLPGS